MSTEENPQVVPFDKKMDAAIMARDNDKVWDILVVDYLLSRMGEKGIVTVTDGETVFQCVKSIPENAQPKEQQP